MISQVASQFERLELVELTKPGDENAITVSSLAPRSQTGVSDIESPLVLPFDLICHTFESGSRVLVALYRPGA